MVSRSTGFRPRPSSDRITFIGNGVVTASPDSTHVLKRDVYEPNETAPHRFDLDAPRPWPYPGTVYNLFLVFNPALLFEPLKRGDSLGVDWYRYGHATARDSDDHSQRTVSARHVLDVSDRLARVDR